MTQNGDETRAMNKQIQSEVTLTPPLLDLPSHLIEEILFRLPVKSLLQLQCLCKRLNSLISDLKFRKNHLRVCFSTNRFQVYTDSVTQLGYSINSYPIHSIFSSIDLFNATTNFECPLFNQDKGLPPFIVGSCDGILCIADYATDLILMCNPSIRKFNQLPLPLEDENPQVLSKKAYGFGYDPSSHNYKVVVVKGNTRVEIHTLGTHSWRSIGDFPFPYPERVGVCFNGTVNWLTTHKTNIPCVIVSLNLENESFQQVPLPNYGRRIEACFSSLSVQRDCFCLVADGDVWMMKEFGNQNSWTKLITISSLVKYPTDTYYAIYYRYHRLLYISEDDKIVLVAYGFGLNKMLVVCDPRNGLVKCNVTKCCPLRLHLSIESLISP